jgi:EAL domain-containing protein (putative c-di-GMP-specific phosphodiesterase class I)
MKLSDLHIRRLEDRCYAAVWGPFLLRSGFQPIFKVRGGPTRIGAFEALCRPFRNDVATSPGVFFPLVARHDAFRVELQTRAIHVLNAPLVLTDREWLFLNFDPSMFKDRQSVEVAIAVMEETLAIAGIDRSRIVCEVTEHRTDESALITLVGQLRRNGYKIAVDDYGADDSDMERVRKLSPDIIKFDAYWITRLMDSGSAGAELLRDMVETFQDRGIETLFEGIEQGWQLDLAVDLGVEFVQGYVLARPQTVPANFHDFRTKQKGTGPTGAVAGMPSGAMPSANGNTYKSWDAAMAEAMETTPALDRAALLERMAAELRQSSTAHGAAPVRPAANLLDIVEAEHGSTHASGFSAHQAFQPQRPAANEGFAQPRTAKPGTFSPAGGSRSVVFGRRS